MPDLLIDMTDNVLVLTLNRPEKLNALSPDMRTGLLNALQEQTDDLSCRAVLIKANGRGFCTGADVQPDQILQRRKHIGDEVEAGINRIIRLITNLPVPVIAAVNGPAAGAGVSLALAADLMLVNRDARFHLSFARIGAVMDGGSSWFLTRTIGARRTASLALSGGNFNAEQALDWGLAHQVVENDELSDTATALAEELAAGPTTALGLIKREIAQAQTQDLDTTLTFEARCQQTAFNTDDFAEGIGAHHQKRKPAFSGQ
ncbi:MAG: enoyl-CoA hydratase-related protein [Marinobacter sp.]|nr:enoyl-CoA hydratase-related protein [Marinobacter sp.]